AERAALFARLRAETPWERSEISIAGRRIPIPRLNAWYGDPGADYSYSGVRLVTTPWTPLLSRVRERVEAATGLVFNSALLNLYRDGADSVDWHADDEPELGEAPQVASLSLGAVRRFELKHRTIPGQRYRLEPPDGSLLMMAGPLQHRWPRRASPSGCTWLPMGPGTGMRAVPSHSARCARHRHRGGCGDQGSGGWRSSP